MHDLMLVVVPRHFFAMEDWSLQQRMLLNHLVLVPLSLLTCWVFFIAFERPFLNLASSATRTRQASPQQKNHHNE
jgi:hypothetical protein